MDQNAFLYQVEEYRMSELQVMIQTGCEVYREQVSRIVESKSDNVAIIGPSETLDQYLSGNPGKLYSIDILIGGYLATFRHFVNKKGSGSKIYAKETPCTGNWWRLRGGRGLETGNSSGDCCVGRGL